jgi:tetratricopeptide (TPR) repeat protein
MKRVLVVFIFLCSVLARPNGGAGAAQIDGQNAEAEIRAAICEIENKNYRAAAATLESVLRKDPQNIYALRLLPGAAARQIKKGDKSAANIAVIRKAIEAYEKAAANPALKNERRDVNDFIIQLYGMIGADEKSAALLKRAENTSEDPKQRASSYTALAAENHGCANDISDVAPVKSTVRRGGREVYVFRKPQRAADFEKLKRCAAKGSELIDKAIALDPESDSAWSYRASLISQLSRVAEMEGKTEEKAALIKEYEAARAKFIEFSDKKVKEQARIDKERLSKEPEDRDLASADLTEEQVKEFTAELKSYRYELTLAETVESVDIPFNLIELISPEIDPTDKPARADNENQKTAWRTFSPAGVFSADLPSNAGVSSTGDARNYSRFYTASGDGLNFWIMETARLREFPENLHDAALNVLAVTIMKYLAGRYVADGRWNDRFESELTKKIMLSDRSARFYAYRLVSCQEKKEGVMIFVFGKKHTYAIDISGAGESDARVQRFLKSLRLD